MHDKSNFMSASLCNNIKAARTQFKICRSVYQGRQRKHKVKKMIKESLCYMSSDESDVEGE